MSSTYEIGDVAVLNWTVKVGNVLTDATVTLTVTLPDGTSSSPSPTHVSTGTYNYSLALPQNGTYSYRWLATGTASAAESGAFAVGAPGPFASAAQLASSLGMDVPTDPLILSRWTDALNDASGYLQALIGQPISAGTATLSLTTDHRGEADIWLVPVTKIVSVTDPEGNVLTTDDYFLVDQRLNLRRGCTTYQVVISFGYSVIPTEIVRWTKVLAATQIQVAANGTLGLSNVSSVAVDDAKISYTDAMAVLMPDSAAQWLKATFGGPQ